ncbi:MAG: rRNA maturation RNase YbeY [Chloroflexi bacterium]|nr:rRNA maturation RNase YbeY [Chloroflexota bacterium]
MVTIHTKTRLFPFVDEDFLYRVADVSLKILDLDHVGVSISLEGNEKIRELNRQYRGLDEPTDVLSFESGEVDPETGEVYLGDVVISLPKVRVQAKQAGHAVRDELALLIVHGILHLNGYDHADQKAEKEMFALQDEILKLIRNQTLPKKSESLLSSFRFAILGLLSAFRSERNMWIHLSVSLIVLIAGFVLNIQPLEWALIIFSIALVFTTELINTSMEYLVNLIKGERNELVRRIKDISAAAVMIAAMSAAIIGFIVFLPKILALT